MDDLKQLRRKIIEKVIEVEGGWVNDPVDSGGETQYGITQATARKHGLEVKAVTREKAYEIYESDYWNPLILDEVLKISSPEIATELFDTGVNTGPANAVTFLQRALNSLNNRESLYPDVAVDGGMGSQTLSALRSYCIKRGERGKVTLFNVLNGLQSAYYVSLAESRPKDEKYSHGWLSNRVALLPDHEGSDYQWDSQESLGPAINLNTGKRYQDPEFEKPAYWEVEETTPKRKPAPKPTKRMPWYLRFVTSKINWTAIASLAIGSGILGGVDLSPEQQSAVVSTIGAVGSAGVVLLRTFWNSPK